jgi:hypothetical protein
MDIDALAHQVRQTAEKVAGIDPAALDKKVGEAFDYAVQELERLSGAGVAELVARIEKFEMLVAGLAAKIADLEQVLVQRTTPKEEDVKEEDVKEEVHKEDQSKKKKT